MNMLLGTANILDYANNDGDSQPGWPRFNSANYLRTFFWSQTLGDAVRVHSDDMDTRFLTWAGEVVFHVTISYIHFRGFSELRASLFGWLVLFSCWWKFPHSSVIVKSCGGPTAVYTYAQKLVEFTGFSWWLFPALVYFIYLIYNSLGGSMFLK